ncbi:hypothetical protein BDZ90DRAFT_233349 [Jaminaea rosea]|uniref:Uncharacterized protein n=1 Tax=Jaminaea rosea TaxID=1569628 RepID=A0A316USV6_9BASI|nr:hypothetical protein BDZ90DRAFT_233349 [Jaminaea rosea]PWN26215.1 hypothetical protein BDZ90DRAFT_233349 [Jaminaea rosea]
MTSQDEAGPSTPKQPFQTDVRRTRGLQAGQILLGRRQNVTSAYDGDGSSASASSSSLRDLKEEEERLNKRIDDSVRSLESGMVDLIQSFRLGDKSVARAEQERFTAEYRADQVVRATSSLAALGRALQLSLLLSQAKEARDRQDEERRRLSDETNEYKKRCGVLLGHVFDVGDGVNQLPQQVSLDLGNKTDIESIIAATAAAAAAAPPPASAGNDGGQASAQIPWQSQEGQPTQGQSAAGQQAAMDMLTNSLEAASDQQVDNAPGDVQQQHEVATGHTSGQERGVIGGKGQNEDVGEDDDMEEVI